MDFLDPVKKRAHTRRLFIGYGLMSILIAMTATVLLFYTYGYNFDPRTGNVTQNGLVFVSSQPGGANVYVNGELKDRTDSRFSLPAGHYDFELNAEGYRQWKRSLDLDGGTIERLNYPFLFPSQLKVEESELLPVLPHLATQSPNRRWLVLAQPGEFNIFTRYDLNDPANPASTVTVAADLFSAYPGARVIKAVEWSSDNNQLLIEHSSPAGREFIMINLETPAASFNVNRLFKINPAQVSLRSRSAERLYVLIPEGGLLQTADVRTGLLTPLLTGVLTFKAHTGDVVLYVAPSAVAGGSPRFMILDKGQSYQLRETVSGSAYLLDVARYSGNWHFAVGAASEGRVYVYKNPVDTLRRETERRPTPSAILKIDQPIKLSFSPNSRFVALQSGQKFGVYDNETQRQYRFDITEPLNTEPAAWMDSYHFVAASDGQIIVLDYDGTNPQKLMSSQFSPTAFFNQDYNAVYSLAGSPSVSGRFALLRASLRAQ